MSRILCLTQRRRGLEGWDATTIDSQLPFPPRSLTRPTPGTLTLRDIFVFPYSRARQRTDYSESRCGRTAAGCKA